MNHTILLRSMTSCYKCEAEITFSDEYISERTGRRIPLDAWSGDPHRCPMYKRPRKYDPCYTCGALIYFDDDAPKSINGKFVSHDQRTGIAHQCPESDSNGGGRTSATMTDEDRLARPEKIEENLVRMQEAKRQEDPLN